VTLNAGNAVKGLVLALVIIFSLPQVKAVVFSSREEGSGEEVFWKTYVTPGVLTLVALTIVFVTIGSGKEAFELFKAWKQKRSQSPEESRDGKVSTKGPCRLDESKMRPDGRADTGHVAVEEPARELDRMRRSLEKVVDRADVEAMIGNTNLSSEPSSEARGAPASVRGTSLQYVAVEQPSSDASTVRVREVHSHLEMKWDHDAGQATISVQLDSLDTEDMTDGAVVGTDSGLKPLDSLSYLCDEAPRLPAEPDGMVWM
jgi:hypothetical protein